MKNLDQLNKEFAIKNEIEFTTLQGGLICAQVSNEYAEATISLYGAHIISFKPRNERDLLWMSPKSDFEIGKPIRGGIPICFPWFGPHSSDSSLPMHGFARLNYWGVVETKKMSDNKTCICLGIKSNADTKKLWPYEFKAQMEVIIGKEMEVRLNVFNTGSSSFDYSCAIHTYYNISDICNIKIEGLQGTEFFTAYDENIQIQDNKYIEVTNEENRRHINTTADCIIHDKGYNRKILAAKKGSKSTVVWNPWSETIKKMPDLPEEGYKNYLCIEPANAFNDCITLQSEQNHITTAIIGVKL